MSWTGPVAPTNILVVQRPLFVIYATTALGAAGVGIIFPILPRLLADVTHARDVSPYLGITAALYAIAQFTFAPVLGALSDTLGRRRVLLASLAGAVIDYVFMAVAPQLWLLLVGRAIAGLTSANASVAMAYLTDVSPPEDRAHRFGLLNAMFGIGFIAGPVVGGVLGDRGVRLPFVAAAVLNLATLVVAWFLLPESRAPSRREVDARPSIAALNPLRPLRWVLAIEGLVPITIVFFVLSAAGEVYGTCWALWSYDAFRWNGRWIGLSLGAFGVCQVLAQALLPGRATRWFGERGAALAGIGCTCLALVALAFARRGWIVFAAMPVFALGGIGVPALQARATRQVAPELQGQLQGVLASVVSLASIAAPLAYSSIYGAVRGEWPGAIWLSVVATHLLAVPLVIVCTRPTRSAPR